MLSKIYPDEYGASSAQANVASITFAGTVLGMLFFGYASHRRMIISTQLANKSLDERSLFEEVVSLCLHHYNNPIRNPGYW